MMGFNAFHSVKATLDGIKTAHMIRKGQLTDEKSTGLQAIYGFSWIWITLSADKCVFTPYEYLRQNPWLATGLSHCMTGARAILAGLIKYRQTLPKPSPTGDCVCDAIPDTQTPVMS